MPVPSGKVGQAGAVVTGDAVISIKAFVAQRITLKSFSLDGRGRCVNGFCSFGGGIGIAYFVAIAIG